MAGDAGCWRQPGKSWDGMERRKREERNHYLELRDDGAGGPDAASRRVSRREAIGLMGVVGAWTLACGGGESPTSPSSTTPVTSPGTGTTPGGGSNAACVVTPQETVGPFPSLSDFIRSDIREGRSGLRLTLTITVVNVAANCAPVSNAVVDVWHCDIEGAYSQYGSARAETFLRGVQMSDAEGKVTFTTIYPGWYQGRATHIHVDVGVGGRSVKVTQIAFPEDVTAAVYRTGVYASRGQNPTTNAQDGVFGDGFTDELATLTGDPSSGYTATFRVGVTL
jgi:protocatechuate 3,4-dioxygenase beta subunit